MQELDQIDINELIAGYLAGQLDGEQLEALNAWIKAGENNKRYFDDMRELWLVAPAAFPGKPFNKEAAYRLFLSRKQKKSPVIPVKRHPVYIWLTGVAAALVIGFLIGIFYEYPQKQDDATPQTVSHYDVIVPYGSRNRIVLADGTKVWLNAGSRLRYATDFGQNSREVYLEGEGYFDVAKDTSKLFVVKTDRLDIKALGTSFNVKAYPNEENIETILVTGKVSIGDVKLSPNEMLIYTRKDQKTIIEKKVSEIKAATDEKVEIPATIAKVVETQIDPVVYTSWKDELWRIESEMLGNLAVKLERRYDVRIRFTDNSTKALSVNASIKNESLEQVLRLLQLTVPIDFSIDGKMVVLKENKYLKEKYRDHYKQKEDM